MHRPKPILIIKSILWLPVVVIFHAFLYFTIISFGGLWDIAEDALMIGFGVLSILFFMSSIYAAAWDNKKSRYLYYLSAVWLGILHFLSIASFLVWIVYSLDTTLPMKIIMDILFIIALILALYSIYHAKRIIIKKIPVKIRNLPDNWQGKKIALISDVHIGHINRARYLRNIVHKINGENVELLCIAGDLFDGMDGRLEHLLDPLNDITATHGVVYADGNHETYLGVERAFRALSHTKTRILRDERVTLDGLDIIGIDYPEPGEHKDIAKTITSLPGYNKEAPSILIYHTPHQVYEIAETGVNLELCGHTHRGQLWPYGIITYMGFGRFHYGLSTLGNYNIYTSSGVGTWGPPMRLGTDSEIVIIELLQK